MPIQRVASISGYIPFMQLQLSHNQNPVSTWSNQSHVKKKEKERGRPQLFMVGIVPYQPEFTRVLIVAQLSSMSGVWALALNLSS